jgi:hypothetical protein
MPIHSGDKGKRAERELRNMLIAAFPQLHECLRRNKDQDAFGGCDLKGLTGFAPECKHVSDSVWRLNEVWKQTLASVEKDEIPVVFRKISLRGWFVYVHLSDLCPGLYGEQQRDADGLAVISFPAFVTYARSKIPATV